MFAEILERKDLTADDKIEAMGRRGFAQFQLKDLDTAERTFQSALCYFNSIETEERLETDFYLGLVRVPPGARSRTSASGPSRCACRRSRWAIDMEDKARLLLAAQRQYIDTIKLGNPQWASASGYQVGSLYEEFYDAFIHAPDPRRAAGRRERRRSARSTTRSCARRSASCSRSRCARTSRTC